MAELLLGRGTTLLILSFKKVRTIISFVGTFGEVVNLKSIV